MYKVVVPFFILLIGSYVSCAQAPGKRVLCQAYMDEGIPFQKNHFLPDDSATDPLMMNANLARFVRDSTDFGIMIREFATDNAEGTDLRKKLSARFPYFDDCFYTRLELRLSSYLARWYRENTSQN